MVYCGSGRPNYRRRDEANILVIDEHNMLMNDQKECSKCHIVMPITEFHRDRTASDGLYSSCKGCKQVAVSLRPRDKVNSAARRWYGNNRERGRELNRKSYLKHRDKRLAEKFARNLEQYGLTATEYEQLLTDQASKCAICHLPESSKTKGGEVKKLSVDHDHQTGEVRGLLCDNCNRGLGMLQDSVYVLEGAVRYLNRSKRA